MATRYSPSIVKSGLVMCLDAGAVRSYPGAGPQLVVNGDFASDITTGWEAGGGTSGQSHDTGGDGGRLKLVDGGGNSRLYSSAAITLVVGQKYRFSVSVSGGNSNHFVHCDESQGGNGTPLTNFTLGGGDGTYVHDFVATHDEFWIHLGATGGSTQYYDQVSLVAIASNLSLPGDSGYSSGVSYGVPGANQWSDLSGNNNNAVISNMQYDLDAASGAGGTRYFDFDGSSDYMTISSPSFAADGFTNGLTCEAWLRFDTASLSGSDTGFITRYQAGQQSQFLFGYRENGGQNGLTFYMTADDNSVPGAPYDTDWTPATDRWYHVVAVYIPSTQIEIFVDGASVFTSTLSGSTPSQLNDDSTLDVMIGNYVGGTYFNGKIAILRMYDRALTIGEAQQNYRTHKGRFGK